MIEKNKNNYQNQNQSGEMPTSVITEVGDLGLGVEELSDSDKKKLNKSESK